MEAWITPYYENGRFYNWDKQHYHYLNMIKMGVGYCIRHPLQVVKAYRRSILQYEQESQGTFYNEAFTIQWLGHATFLIKIGSVTILTDPVFYELPFPFPKRLFAPLLSISQLPKIDVVLISHYHLDHFDTQTLHDLLVQYNPIFLMPLGCRQYLPDWMNYLVYEKNWWQDFTIFDVTCSLLPAYHWSGNSRQTINKSLWGSWMISYQDYYLYFAGDTAYNIHFDYIAQKFPSIDVALLPFHTATNQEYKQMLHLDLQGFYHASQVLNPKKIIPMHWGTFSLYQDRYRAKNVLQDFLQNQLVTLPVCFLQEGQWYDIKKG